MAKMLCKCEEYTFSGSELDMVIINEVEYDESNFGKCVSFISCPECKRVYVGKRPGHLHSMDDYTIYIPEIESSEEKEDQWFDNHNPSSRVSLPQDFTIEFEEPIRNTDGSKIHDDQMKDMITVTNVPDGYVAIVSVLNGMANVKFEKLENL